MSPARTPGDFIRSDGRPDTAAAKGHFPLDLTRCNGSGHVDDEIGIVVREVQLKRDEVHDLMPRSAERVRHVHFQSKPAVVRRDSHTH